MGGGIEDPGAEGRPAEWTAVRCDEQERFGAGSAAAGDVLSKQMTAEAASSSIDEAIAQVEARLH